MNKPKFADKVEAVNKQQSDSPTVPAPKIETYSNKSRDFRKKLKKKGKKGVTDQVNADVKELLDKYSGELEIRIDKPSKLKVMRGLTVEVEKMYLVYHDDPELITTPTRKLIVDAFNEAADGHPVEVLFRR